jgi:CRP-like cAMP-binding protein
MNDLKTYFNTIHPLDDSTLEKLFSLFREEKISKGGFYIKEGQTAKEMAFLKTGVVRAFYTNQEGQEYNKHFFTGASIIGSYSSLISGNPSLFSQQALTDCEILTANYNSITNLYSAYPALERLARKFAENYFVANEKKEIEIVLLQADKRYLNFRKQYPELENQIAQYHIASYLGVSPTQLSRIRKKMASN